MSQQYIIYADSDKCRGCKKCELACIASHNGVTIKEAAKLRKDHEPRVHVVKTDTLKMPVQCRQCEEAPCALVCPTHALIQNNKGKVIMRTEYCAGCGLCVMACPYGAISKTFVETTEDEKKRLERKDPRLIAVRCDLCEQWRHNEGKEVSACVEACAFGALRMIPLDEYRALMSGGELPHTALEKKAEEKTEQPKPAEKPSEAEEAPKAEQPAQPEQAENAEAPKTEQNGQTENKEEN